MNVEELLNIAEQAMNRVVDRSYGTYKLVIRKGQLVCVVGSNNSPDDIFIAKITRFQLEDGLSETEWAALGVRLFNIWKELKL